MANEISFSTTVGLTRGSQTQNFVGNFNETQATAGSVQRTQSIPTADTVITVTGVTTPRIIWIKNTDPTNYIDIGPTSGGALVPAMRLQPGQMQPILCYPGAVWRGLAHTGAVIIEIFATET